MSKLSALQIDELYAFTRQHFVIHYDVQTELVDHLANAIEAIWEVTPSLSFEEAKQESFKKFGVFGFMEVVEQKQKAMNKRYWLYLWKFLKTWFHWPQIMITSCLFLMFYMAFSSIYAAGLSLFFYVSIALWMIFKGIQLNRQYRKRKEQSSKRWLLEELIFRQAGGTVLLVISQVFNVFTISDKAIGSPMLVILLASVFTLLVLVNYICFQFIPKRVEIFLEETYPEYKIV